MERKQITELIKKLKNLQLREAELISRIDEANASLSGHRGATVEHDFEKGDRVSHQSGKETRQLGHRFVELSPSEDCNRNLYDNGPYLLRHR
jgi:hypothetical protein